MSRLYPAFRAIAAQAPRQLRHRPHWASIKKVFGGNPHLVAAVVISCAALGLAIADLALSLVVLRMVLAR